MNYYGEVRVYLGGKMELSLQGDEFVAMWVTGSVISKFRYHNKSERQKYLKKAMETFGKFGEIEIGIIPNGEWEYDSEVIYADNDKKIINERG